MASSLSFPSFLGTTSRAVAAVVLSGAYYDNILVEAGRERDLRLMVAERRLDERGSFGAVSFRVGRSCANRCPFDTGERAGPCTAADRRHAPTLLQKSVAVGGDRDCVLTPH